MSQTVHHASRWPRPRRGWTSRKDLVRRFTVTVGPALVLVLVAGGCGALPAPAPTPSATQTGQPSRKPGSSPNTPDETGCRSSVVAAGDIVNDVDIAIQTGRLAAEQQPDLVLLLGDNQYPDGSLARYRSQYDRTTWGRLKPITKPVPGNHEYRTPDAAGYFTYFNHPPAYYAYDAGCGWRGYALNSEIDLSPQLAWLRRDLAAHPGAAVLASWHKPRWSSGAEHGSNTDMQPLWTALSGRSGVVLNGHEHNYERFAQVDGFREFVVGTGGSSQYPFGSTVPGSERRISRTPGVLRLDLQPHGVYRWTFIDTASTSLDTGLG